MSEDTVRERSAEAEHKDDHVDQSREESGTELDVQSKEDPPHLNGREYESEAELEPVTEKKQQSVGKLSSGNRGQGQVQRLEQQQRAQGQLQAGAPHQIPTKPTGLGPLRKEEQRTGHIGGPYGVIRQSRIKDRPVKPDQKDSLSIKIELDLEVEVDLYARVKGDVMIGLL